MLPPYENSKINTAGHLSDALVLWFLLYSLYVSAVWGGLYRYGIHVSRWLSVTYPSVEDSAFSSCCGVPVLDLKLPGSLLSGICRTAQL